MINHETLSERVKVYGLPNLGDQVKAAWQCRKST